MTLEQIKLLSPAIKAVGYWCPLPGQPACDEDEVDMPHPGRLVASDWRPGDRARIAAYLKSGCPFQRFRGYSYCRFACGIDNSEMGSRTLTDGERAWPEGLAHYIESHEVCLPDVFVTAMERRGCYSIHRVT